MITNEKLQQLVTDWRAAAAAHEEANSKILHAERDEDALIEEVLALKNGTKVLHRVYANGVAAGYADGLRQAAKWLAELQE